MNTKGTKFLAVFAVLAMAFAGFAVIADSEQSDAVAIAHNAKWTAMDASQKGIIDFAASLDDATYGDFSNGSILKSNIVVSYDASTTTYTVTGTLYKQSLTDEESAFYKLWPSNTEYYYGLGAMIDIPGEGDLALTGGEIDGNAHYDGAASDDLLFYIKSTGVRYVTFTPTAGEAVTYTIDFSGVTLSDTKASDAPAGYVALAGANALADGATSGNDGADGTWTYTSNILTLNQYQGCEVFYSATLAQVTLVGDNKIEATAAYAIKSDATFTIKPVEGQGDLDIVLKGAGAVTAISGAATVNIQATSLSIAVPESGDGSFGISATTVNVYESVLEISMDATTGNTGVAATDFDIKSCALISMTANEGVAATNMSIAASDVNITSATGGIVLTGMLSAMKNTTIDADASIVIGESIEPVYGIEALNVSAESESVITADKMRFASGTNNATIDVAGNVVLVAGGVFTNKSDMSIGGDLLVMGNLANTGNMNVAGKTVLMKMNEAPVSPWYSDVTAPTAENQNFVKGITVTKATVATSTTLYIEGVVTFANTADDIAVDYAGIATVDESGLVSDISITIYTIDTSGTDPRSCVATVPVTYVTGATAAESGYVIAAAGEVSDAGAAAVVLTNSQKMDVAKAAIVGTGSTPAFVVSDGVYTAVGGIFAYYTQAGLVSADGEIIGDITVGEGADITTTGGTIEGDVATKSALTLGGVLKGNVASSQDVTIDDGASVTGNISMSAAATVTLNGTLDGDVVVADKAVTVAVTGKMTGDITLEGKYKSSAGAAAADTDYQVTIELDMNKGTATTFTTTAAVETTPGFISVGANFGTPANDKASSVIVKEGVFKLTANLTIPETVDLTIESGATLEVASVATITINGAIKAEDGAIINIYDADAKVYSYGKLTNELTFYVEPYTYYCSFTYALANAPEGTELNITKDVTVNANATVKKDVTVNVGENRTITFAADKILSMAEGASFVLSDGAKIVFTARTADTKVDSGLFVYGDNELVLDAAYFKTNNATITAVKETATVPANFSFVGTVAAGEVKFSEGLFNGTVTFETLGAGTEVSPFTSGTATIAEGAVYNGTYIKDAQGKANFVIDGTWKISAAKTIDMALSGDGNIELADGVILTINKGYAAAAADRVAQTLNVTYGDNAVKMAEVVIGDATIDTNMVVTAVKATSTVPSYLKIEGSAPATGVALFSGTIEIEGAVSLGKSFLDADAMIIVPADAALTLIKDTTTVAVGLLSATGTFNFNLADDTTKTYGVLDSQISYEDGSATVYAALATAITKGGVTDFTVSSNIEMEGGDAAAPKDLGNVTLAVAEGKKLTLTGYVTLGTAATTVGAAPGITGNIVLADGAVLIVYDNATVDADSVYANAGMTVKAAMSEYIISFNDAVYATIFANHTGGPVTFVAVQGALSPSFDGYRFTGYEPYVAGATKIGDCDVAINLEAGKVSITLAAVEGVTYYINGAACKQTGAPVQVVVGSVVSAQANAGYTGAVKVNGQDYITVDPTTKTITASGASPITPEPAPAEGLGLTEILLIVLVILIAIMVVVLLIRLNRS